MVTNFDNFIKENNNSSDKLIYSIAGKAWNTLWENKSFKFKDIYIINEYNEDTDTGIFKLYIKDKKTHYGGYDEISSHDFHWIDEERVVFFEWLKELGLLK